MKEFLYEHALMRPVSFHMPGHKGSSIFKKYGYEKFLETFMDMDVTEIPGADNLFDANGIIAAIQDRYAALYGARRSWLSVGGTSASLIAAILAVCDQGNKKKKPSVHDQGRDKEKTVGRDSFSLFDGEVKCGSIEDFGKTKIIMARNCHKAVFNGLRLADAVPVYVYPTVDPVQGISGAVSPGEIKRITSENPDAAAVVITSPDYYGVCSDIKSIARICHDAGMVLIVDQAHGAHLKFFHSYGCGSGMPLAAEDQGADIVCNSTHKTLASMTQSAILNLCSDRVDPELIEEKLQMIESSSPSYVLMTSLDICAELLERHGSELIGEWRSNLEHFYTEATKIKGLKFMDIARKERPRNDKGDNDKDDDRDSIYDSRDSLNEDRDHFDDGCCSFEDDFRKEGNSFFAFDGTKLNLDIGMPGADAEKLLNEKGIFPELHAGRLLMCMTGIGNTRADYDALLDALRDMVDVSHEKDDPINGSLKKTGVELQPGGFMGAYPPSERFMDTYPQPGRFIGIPSANRKIHFTQAEGTVCAVSIIPYPPGIPLVCPGEEITSEVISFVYDLMQRNEKILGIDEKGMISIGIS